MKRICDRKGIIENVKFLSLVLFFWLKRYYGIRFFQFFLVKPGNIKSVLERSKTLLTRLKKNGHLFNLIVLLLHFHHSNVPDSKSYKQKQGVLFFTRIKLMARVLTCACAIAHIKWIRLVNLYSWKESPYVILYCQGCRNKSIAIFSFKNLTLHKTFQQGCRLQKQLLQKYYF